MTQIDHMLERATTDVEAMLFALIGDNLDGTGKRVYLRTTTFTKIIKHPAFNHYARRSVFEGHEGERMFPLYGVLFVEEKE